MNANEIIAKAYHDSALSKDVNMLKAAELLENFRRQVNEEKPFDTWENLKIDLSGNETLIPRFIDLLRQYYSGLLKETELNIDNAFKKIKTEGPG